MARGGIRNGPRKFERQQTPDQLWPETLKLYWADDVDRLRSARDVCEQHLGVEGVPDSAGTAQHSSLG